jgi:hypothetical protein
MSDVPEVEFKDEETVEMRLPERHGARLTAEQMAEKSPEYPYGRKADGTPKSKPGPAKGAGARPAPGPRRAPAPGRKKSAAPSAAARAAGQKDYTEGIMGLFQMPAMGLMMVGRQTGNVALQADGYALAQHGPGIAAALNETAQQQPQVAKALDSILKVGPYGALITALVPLVVQLAANHDAIPPVMGAIPKEHLAAAADAEMSAMAAQMAAQHAAQHAAQQVAEEQAERERNARLFQDA